MPSLSRRLTAEALGTFGLVFVGAAVVVVNGGFPNSGIGLLMDALRATHHIDDTLVVYLSDNGAPFPGAKTTLYDSGIHLPLVIRAPDQPKRGIRNPAMVSWIDLLPTCLDVAPRYEPPATALASNSFSPEGPKGRPRTRS